MYSPYEDILGTNVVPTDAECDNIRALLQAPRKELADVTQEITRLQSLIDEATRKRDELEQYIDAHLALVSPVRRLPEDIVRAIFMETLPASRNCTLSSDEMPLLLCRICKSWRALALTTPRIWASIHIVVPAPSKLPQLTEKSIVVKHNEDIEGSLMFLATRSLRRIECTGTPSILDGPVSWGSLTHFTVSPISTADALRILHQCPLLETCDLVFRGRLTASDAYRTPVQLISLPRLLHLSISYTRVLSTDGPHFFDNIVVPALRYFHCCCYGMPPANIPLRCLFPSMPVHLEHLKVHVLRFASSTLLAALAEMPSLKDLHIFGEPWSQPGPEQHRDPEFLVHLTPVSESVDSDSVLCPKLRRVELTNFKEVSDNTLLEFIRSRTGPRIGSRTSSEVSNVVQLARFSCALKRPMERDIHPDLENVGCLVTLKYQIAPPRVYSPLEGIEEAAQ
ncbi:hypothetical protein MVEN_00618200 [Mycena venus]|uniref:F-box domain-containing protein n=1 Tax=Mycena venus TaxID=2733690 RepID=A0A8H6YQH9_9AGAR|nr:hypothetical protein MVEN_00618200 [Mycena venus]